MTHCVHKANMRGDGTSQLCSNGVITATAVSTVSRFGFCTFNNGELVLPSTVSIDATRISIQGQISGVQSLTLSTTGCKFSSSSSFFDDLTESFIHEALLELYGRGHTVGYPAGTFYFGGNFVVQTNCNVKIYADTSTTNGLGVTIMANSLTLSSGKQKEGMPAIID